MWFGVSGSPQFVALAISEVGVLCVSLAPQVKNGHFSRNVSLSC